MLLKFKGMRSVFFWGKMSDLSEMLDISSRYRSKLNMEASSLLLRAPLVPD